MTVPVSLAIYVCTFARNDPLANLLDALVVASERADDDAKVAVVVIDDNPDGSARRVAKRYEGRFPLGIHYRHSGARNISVARNLGLSTAIELGDWVAMTDDDCEPCADWLVALLDVQRRTGADAISGPLELRVPAGSPRWLTEQPFLETGLMHHDDGDEIPIAATHNSLIRSAFLVEHPDIRFAPDLGTVGGEDMVFYRRARQAGLRIRFSEHAVVYAVEPPERTTFRHQLRTHYWLGNTEYVTNREVGAASRPRLALRGARNLGGALARPVQRMARRQPPQLRFCAASVCQAAGLLVGAAGVRVRHH